MGQDRHRVECGEEAAPIRGRGAGQTELPPLPYLLGVEHVGQIRPAAAAPGIRGLEQGGHRPGGDTRHRDERRRGDRVGGERGEPLERHRKPAPIADDGLQPVGPAPQVAGPLGAEVEDRREVGVHDVRSREDRREELASPESERPHRGRRRREGPTTQVGKAGAVEYAPVGRRERSVAPGDDEVVALADLVDRVVREDLVQGAEHGEHELIVQLVRVQPLAEYAAGTERGAHALVELHGEEAGHATDPRIRRLRHDQVEALRPGGEIGPGVVDDRHCPRVIVGATIDRIELPPRRHHLRFDLDRDHPLERTAPEQHMGAHSRTEPDHRCRAGVGAVRVSDEGEEHLGGDVAVERGAGGKLVAARPPAALAQGGVGLPVAADRQGAAADLLDHGDAGGATVAIAHHGRMERIRDPAGPIDPAGQQQWLQRDAAVDQDQQGEQPRQGGRQGPPGRTCQDEASRRGDQDDPEDDVDPGGGEQHPLHAEQGKEQQPAQHHADDGADGVPGIDRSDDPFAGSPGQQDPRDEREGHPGAAGRGEHDRHADGIPCHGEPLVAGFGLGECGDEPRHPVE